MKVQHLLVVFTSYKVIGTEIIGDLTLDFIIDGSQKAYANLNIDARKAIVKWLKKEQKITIPVEKIIFVSFSILDKRIKEL